MIIRDPEGHTSGVATALFFIIFTTGFKYYFQDLKQQYLLQEVEFKRIQTELSLLKAQLHPHFFFNTLNNLFALSMEPSEQVPKVILKLAGLMRYVLDCSKKKTIPLRDNIQFIADYVELEKLRFSGTPDIRFHVDGESGGEFIAPMLLIPFVENGFKHGMMATAKSGYIHIDATIRNSIFLFTVENSKPVKSLSKEDVSRGIGLKNVKRRLELHYPESHELIVQDVNDKHFVQLRIEL